MSGHSKWAQIKHKKGATDAKRGAIFSKHAKLIAIAAKAGGDPLTNAALRMAIDNAKADNLPNSNIERAIKTGTGELKDAAEIVESYYDAYGPAGTAFYIHVLTDNKNRTIANIKAILNKYGGRLGEAGSVAWMFEKKGIIVIKAEEERHEEVELLAIDAGAADVKGGSDYVEVVTSPSNLAALKEKLLATGLAIESAAVNFQPQNVIMLDNENDTAKVLRLEEALEEDEDVVSVYGNFDIKER